MKQAFPIKYLISGLFIFGAQAVNAHTDEFLHNVGVSAEINYTKTASDGLMNGALIVFPDENSNDFAYRTLFIHPDFEFNYALGLHYRIPCTKTTAYVHYDHYRDGEDQDVEDTVNLGIPFDLDDSTTGFGQLRDHLTEFAVGLARPVFNHRLVDVDASAFFGYNRVGRTVFESIQDDSGNSADLTVSNNAKGWGPGVGMKARFHPWHNPHWSFFTLAKYSLFFADVDYDTEFDINTSRRMIGLLDEPYHKITEDSHSVISKMELAFGFDYKSSFLSDFGRMGIDVSLGIRFLNVFNAFKNGDAMNVPVLNQQVIDDGSECTMYPLLAAQANDFGRWGPFLKFTLGGMKQ